jgi:hypothetical protein
MDLPIACTLDAGAMDARLDDWRQVLSAATAREDTADGVRLRFPHDQELAARLAALAVAETGCCAFFRFSLTAVADALWLDVDAPPEARPIVEQLVGLA